MPKIKEIEGGGGECILGVSVFQKVTLNTTIAVVKRSSSIEFYSLSGRSWQPAFTSPI